MEMLLKREMGTAKILLGGIFFVKYPPSKKVMASTTNDALIGRANKFER